MDKLIKKRKLEMFIHQGREDFDAWNRISVLAGEMRDIGEENISLTTLWLIETRVIIPEIRRLLIRIQEGRNNEE